MICVMKSSLKTVQKTKITFLLSKTLLFFFKHKYILFLDIFFFFFFFVASEKSTGQAGQPHTDDHSLTVAKGQEFFTGKHLE